MKIYKYVLEGSLLFVLAFMLVALFFGIKAKAMGEECFKTLYKESYGSVIYDTRTGVEYWRSEGVYNWGSLTLLVDEEGKPLIYNE